MKKNLFIFVLCLSVINVIAQDIIYTVSGEINENKTALDSILIENLTNSTRSLFGNLPDLDYYQINLTQNAFWGAVGINNFKEAPLFDVSENRPGSVTIAYLKNTPTDIQLEIYNINGQKVYVSEKKMLKAGNSIRVQLSSSGVFFVKIEAPVGIRTFKVIGADNFKEYDVEISDISTKATVKSAVKSINNDFSFNTGDSIRVSVYKWTYNAPQQNYIIDSSRSVNFLFEVNSSGEISSLTDSRDGKTYKTITINGEEWFTEELAYLPGVNMVTSESITDPFHYVYGYNDTIVSEAIATDNYSTHGVLYNWPAALESCPSGWHVPTKTEWEQLARFITEQKGLTHTTGDFWVDVAKYLKATSGWENDANGTDDYGYSALPGGYRHGNGNFYGMGSYGFWWSSTELSNMEAFTIFMEKNSDTFIQSHIGKNFGYSIRCIKD